MLVMKVSFALCSNPTILEEMKSGIIMFEMYAIFKMCMPQQYHNIKQLPFVGQVQHSREIAMFLFFKLDKDMKWLVIREHIFCGEFC